MDEYRKHIEKDAALERRFAPIYVEEPSVDDTIKMLHGLRDRYEAHHKVRFSDEALSAAPIWRTAMSQTVTCRIKPST